jgi:hypothetical protein
VERICPKGPRGEVWRADSDHIGQYQNRKSKLPYTSYIFTEKLPLYGA